MTVMLQMPFSVSVSFSFREGGEERSKAKGERCHGTIARRLRVRGVTVHLLTTDTRCGVYIKDSQNTKT
jgi:hypothetical protein